MVAAVEVDLVVGVVVEDFLIVVALGMNPLEVIAVVVVIETRACLTQKSEFPGTDIS